MPVSGSACLPLDFRHRSDKKMVGNQVKFILLHTIGDAYIYRELSDAQILDGIRYVCRA